MDFLTLLSNEKLHILKYCLIPTMRENICSTKNKGMLNSFGNARLNQTKSESKSVEGKSSSLQYAILKGYFLIIPKWLRTSNH